MAITSGLIQPPGPGVGVAAGSEGVGVVEGGGVPDGGDESDGGWDDTGVDAVGPTGDVADGDALDPGDGSEV